jgi:hypothetical protein
LLVSTTWLTPVVAPPRISGADNLRAPRPEILKVLGKNSKMFAKWTNWSGSLGVVHVRGDKDLE